jgi:hypothetical protein
VEDRRRRCHWVRRIELATASDCAERQQFIAGYKRPTDTRKLPFVTKRYKILAGVVVSGSSDPGVLVDHCLSLVLEGVFEDSHSCVELNSAEKHQCAQGNCVLHHRLHSTKGLCKFS